jgi:hypothetical protein
MSSSAVVFHCQRCGLEIDPNSSDVVRLVRWMKPGTVGADERVEGVGHLFHAGHAPRESDEWRRIS